MAEPGYWSFGGGTTLRINDDQSAVASEVYGIHDSAMNFAVRLRYLRRRISGITDPRMLVPATVRGKLRPSALADDDLEVFKQFIETYAFSGDTHGEADPFPNPDPDSGAWPLFIATSAETVHFWGSSYSSWHAAMCGTYLHRLPERLRAIVGPPPQRTANIDRLEFQLDTKAPFSEWPNPELFDHWEEVADCLATLPDTDGWGPNLRREYWRTVVLTDEILSRKSRLIDLDPLGLDHLNNDGENENDGKRSRGRTQELKPLLEFADKCRDDQKDIQRSAIIQRFKEAHPEEYRRLNPTTETLRAAERYRAQKRQRHSIMMREQFDALMRAEKKEPS